MSIRMFREVHREVRGSRSPSMPIGRGMRISIQIEIGWQHAGCVVVARNQNGSVLRINCFELTGFLLCVCTCFSVTESGRNQAAYSRRQTDTALLAIHPSYTHSTAGHQVPFPLMQFPMMNYQCPTLYSNQNVDFTLQARVSSVLESHNLFAGLTGPREMPHPSCHSAVPPHRLLLRPDISR